MKKSILEKYAELIVHYCVYLKEGETFFIRTTTAAEPLVREIYRVALEAGVKDTQVFFDFEDKARLLYTYGNDEQLAYTNPFTKHAFEHYDAFLFIKADYNLMENQSVDPDRQKKAQAANKAIKKLYSERTASGAMKRSLCLYPTHASAQAAGMSLSEYEDFVFNACKLFADDPKAEWLKVRESQQHIKEYLDQCSKVRYVNNNTDIVFSCEGRTWVNSDGTTNMPSGEVYTSPVEDSVNGHIYFDFPTIYNGKDVEGVLLKVKDGLVVEWTAERGQEVLDEVFQIDGARRFGEAAIGTNYDIQQVTKNILFDEKIGGSVHMAIGQSYLQTGGKNESSVHWDMISGMTDGGQIYADDKLVYENGKFLI